MLQRIIRRLPTVVVALVLATSFATVASAQTDVRETLECVSSGALKACSAFQIVTALDGNGGTHVVIRVQNWDQRTAYQQLLVSLGLTAPSLGNVVLPANWVTLEGGAYATPTAGYSAQDVFDHWKATTFQQPGGGTTLQFGATGTAALNGTGSIESAIAGCNLTSAVDFGAFQTCNPSTGMNAGWVAFNFWTDQEWYAGQAQLSYRYMGVGPTDASLTCPDGSLNCTSETIPEPVSLLLLGSGLLGVGAIGYIRRRREDEV
jgi:hypothetical protein